MNILVVEDDEGMRLMLKANLESRGHNVYVTSEGVGAIHTILDHEIDLLITDYRMETFGGGYWIKFLDRFLRDRFRIIVMTGYDFLENVPFPVLKKPFSTQTLLDLIGKES